MKLSYSVCAVVAVLTLSGCEKELDIDYHDIEPITVIEANLTQDGAAVTVTMTTPMDEPMDTRRLTDVAVTLTDKTMQQVFELEPDADGVYRNAVPGETGHEYQVTVERGAESFESCSTMLPMSEITALEFNWIKMPYDYVAVLQVTFDDRPDVKDEHYWVQLFRNGEAYMWSPVSDYLAVDGQINEVLMTSRKDVSEEDDESVLYDGDVVTVSVTPVSQAMYDYLVAISYGNSNGPAMFGGDFCLGYFNAAPVSTASIVFRPAEIPEYK